jgi:Na+/melibiose symporter-like transporter
MPLFVYWVGRQEKLGRPAIIPNSLWRNSAFTSICIAVFLTWGSFNGLETMLTFFFQDVQLISPLKTSLYFLPAPISGAIANVIVGFVVHRVNAHWLVLGGCAISAVGPLVMAFAKRDSLYWSHAFLANCFNPVGADSLYTVANLLITNIFPPRTHGLAGGVFNTVAQIGRSVGLASVAVIAASVTRDSHYKDKHSPEALLEGYNATFWFCFALIAVTFVTVGLGLRKAGKVGHKRD